MPVKVHEVPAGFDPHSADDATLAAKHFPPRMSVARLYKPGMTFIAPEVVLHSERKHGPRRGRTVSAAAEVSTNWCGDVIYAPPGGSPFSSVSAQWTVPNVDAPTVGMWYYAASWIGIDGDGSNDVCQCGVECDAYRTRRGGVQTHVNAWFEWYPEAEYGVTNFAVRAGDFVSMMIVASGNTATAYMSNLTTGVALSPFEFTAPPGTVLVGNCAEFIVEAPTVNGGQSAVADFGQVFFNGEATLKSGVIFGAGSGDTINLESASGAIDATAQQVNADLVRCAYVGAQP